MPGQWLSIVEYARNFKISDMTVRRRIRTGRLKAVLKDGKYFIPIDSSHHPENNCSDESTIIPNKPNSIPIYPRPSNFQSNHIENVYNNDIPIEISEKVSVSETAVVATRALLDFCNTTIKNSEEKCQALLKEKEAQMGKLLERINMLNKSLSSEKQQVEDLQLLIKVFEKKIK